MKSKFLEYFLLALTVSIIYIVAFVGAVAFIALAVPFVVITMLLLIVDEIAAWVRSKITIGG